MSGTRCEVPGDWLKDQRLAEQLAQPQGVHLPSVNVGCHSPRGQKRTEMTYWPQLWSDDALLGDAGKWGAAVLRKTPIRM